MSAASLVRAGRRAALRYMTATGTTVRLDRATGGVDDNTGQPIVTTVYSGPARVQTDENVERVADVGGATVVVQRYSVHLPVADFAPAIDDIITVTAAALDPNLVGRVFTVRSLLHKSAATAYRLGVQDTNGFGW